MSLNTVVAVVGPTASGKTALAIALARSLRTQVVSFDSRQFFREMSIGTAKPDPQELTQAVHHFIGHLSVTEKYSVGQYEKDSLACLNDVIGSTGTAVLVGGSGLYLDALEHGVDTFPDIDPAIREQIKERYEADGIGFLQAELRRLDPHYAEKVDLNNPHRLIRALEVCLGAAQPYSSFLGTGRTPRNFRVVRVGIDYAREELYARINLRVDKMLDDGLLDEVRGLYPYKDFNALQSVGYREFFDHLDGRISFEWATELVKQNSRNYAKRQLTWFRRQNSGDTLWIAPSQREAFVRDFHPPKE